MPGFHIENFGCRAARADGEAIGSHLRALAANSCSLVAEQPSTADLVIVNTCSVTAEADRAARAFIRRAHRHNPAAKIVVTGCYAQRAPQELAAMPGVKAVIGNSHKALAPQIAFRLLQSSTERRSVTNVQADALVQIERVHGVSAVQAAPALPHVVWAPLVWADDRFAHSFLEEAQLVPGEQTRPNLKIQEGCSNRCSFCVIPLTRGPSKSLPYAVLRRQVEDFLAADGKELVLSGINLGRWGRDLSQPSYDLSSVSGHYLGRAEGEPKREGAFAPARTPASLAALVRDLLEQTSLPRLRLSSIEPMDWDQDLIGLMREFGGARLARHAHLPLQSGSDAVLRRMHRRYRPWHYAAKVEALVSAAGPDLTLGADVMAGFPGETDREFEETLTFIRAQPFAYLHLFPFSPRPGTPGWALHAADPVNAAVVEGRMAALRALAAEKARTHRRRFLGRELPAITLNTPAALARRSRTAALTDNFLPVDLDGRLPANQLLTVRANAMNEAGELIACPAL
jgi:threonylcarbamoyladenosine tRNA methylthiotransferase MtaB